MDELLLGLDVGTSSSRAVLAQPDGTFVGAYRFAGIRLGAATPTPPSS